MEGHQGSRVVCLSGCRAVFSPDSGGNRSQSTLNSGKSGENCPVTQIVIFFDDSDKSEKGADGACGNCKPSRVVMSSKERCFSDFI